MSKIKSASLLVTGVLVGATLAGSTAYAATGGTFVLGRANSASTQTSLTNTGSAPVLALSTKSGQVPLAVSASAGKATGLNADKVDGLDGTQLALASGKVGQIAAEAVPFDVDEDGTADVFVAYAPCPAGSKLTGGGFEDYTPDSGFINIPAENGWLYVSALTDDPTDVVAHATCFNPRGAVAGSHSSNLKGSAAAVPPLTAAQKRAILAKS